MSWQQIVMIVWLAMQVGVSLCTHGVPRTGKNNAIISILSTATMAAILWSGGFWK